MKFLSLQQKLDTLFTKQTLCQRALNKLLVSTTLIQSRSADGRNALTGLHEKHFQHQLALLWSYKGQANMTLYSGKVNIDTAHYGAIWHMFDTCTELADMFL